VPNHQEEEISLEPLLKEHLKQMAAWGEDAEINYLLGLDGITKYWERCADLLGQPNHRLWAIKTGQGCVIGEISLSQICWRVREAELRICIGNRAYWGRGLGKKALQAILIKAFDELKLKRVYLRVYHYNTRALKCYLRCGFKKEAVLRNRYRYGGQNRDIYLMYIDQRLFKAHLGKL